MSCEQIPLIPSSVLQNLDDVLSEIDSRYGRDDVNEVVLSIKCPRCNNTGAISFDKRALLEKKGFVLEYPVPSGMICDHAFMIGIDSTLKIR